MKELFAGVDLGGTAVKAAIADSDGTILTQDSIATHSHDGPNAVLKRIGEFLVDMSNRVSDGHGTLSGVGMGVPGLVDVQNGITKFLPNLTTQWRDVPVADLLSDQLGCPIRLLNDVRTATLGELHFGHGRDRPDITMVFIALGTGVGGGLVIDGRLRLGPLGAAGELGHQTILPQGPRCGCGSRGCLETLASGPAIASEGSRLMQIGLAPTLHDLVDGQGDNVTTKAMSIAAEHDPAIREAIVNAASYVGIAVANVITTLHPDMIVLGGGVAQFGRILLETVRAVVADRVRMFPTESIAIEQSQLGEQAGVMGAVALARSPVVD
ncbi:ROK family protein [Stieleria varia]|uniref:Glucokinase n=1 Tax=Stieleria varia TaxID=2528005 RepID=A0A5C6ASP7_9BACT|nr:ROK family protein [Stieleria varia]TWU02558.1 Glucokinase [Stieleria varia]